MSESPSAGDGAAGAAPRRHLQVRHAIAVCVGTVVGSGIFRASPDVAANLTGPAQLFGAWLMGAVLSVLGALCFAEMSAAFPHAGGDYAFLARAYGRRLALLFAWSRFSVIHTGSMALLAFVFGDYLAQIFNFGAMSSPVFGMLAVLVLIFVNLRGVRLGIGTQLGLMSLVVFGLSCVFLAGLWQAWHGVAPPASAPAAGASRPGAAMIFVLLAYGGWSDAATLSAEMRDERRGIVLALIGGLGIVALLYMGANWGFLTVLGYTGLATSHAPAAEAMRLAFGRIGEVLMVVTVATTAISVMNSLLIVGARTTYAAVNDWSGEVHLGRWDVLRGHPAQAMIAMGVVALLQLVFGSLTLDGFKNMVDFMTPVYWFFLSLSALAVMVLRRRFPDAPRPFRVPGYPFTPLVFFASCLYMLYSSLVYVQMGALVGVAVLALGGLLLLPERRGRGDRKT
jgi:amino acid transporter